MAKNYEYKLKGIDIRVNKGKKKVDPNLEECDWSGCVSLGGCKAPKSPDRLREYYNFCTIHAREYNKNWNFFSGMSDEDISEWQVGARHGHSLSKLQLKALNDLGLDDTASKDDVRKRYTQLVKQLHPDANQGKRNTEESFQRVVSAMKVLKTTNLG